MNSRFDEAVEQILSDIVEEATPGMASAPGAQTPQKQGTSVLGGLGRLGAAALKGATKLAAKGASVGMGFTPGAAENVYGAAKGAAQKIGDIYKGDAKATQTPTQPGTASQPTPATQQQATAPAKTVANIIPTVQPQKINSVISNFPQLNADKTHLQSAVPNMLRGLRGNYTAPELVQMVTGSIPPGSRVRQIASNNAAMNKIGTDLQNYLALSDKDRAQLKAQIPALLRGIKSNATIEDVGQLLTNILS